jgi:HAD superfamily hydrolase (TIGR01509 family)
MSRSLEAVVFDMDGTLVETREVVPAAYRAAVVAGGGVEPSDAEVIAGYSLGAPARLLGHLLGRASTAEDMERYHASLAALAGGVSVYDGIPELLTDAAHTARLAVFTGASCAAARILLDRVGLLGHFAAVVGGDEVVRPKPDPEGVHLACARLGVDPARAAYVGDSPLDLRAARASGALAVAAGWGHLHDAAEPADVLAATPADLRALL